MVVALAAADREAEPDGASCVHAIDDRLDAELLQVDAAFLIDHRVAVKSRGNELVRARLRQQITSKLLDRELIERQIAVESVDDPVAVLPDGPRASMVKPFESA